MTAHRYVDIFEVYDRFRKGARVDPETWDYNIIPKNATLMKKRYDIDFGDNIIPDDQEMVDRLFIAGVDMLLTTGIYNKDTATVATINEDEIYEGLKMAPRKLNIGEGKDAVECVARRGNSPKMPIIEGGPTGSPVSEDCYTNMIMSYAQEPTVDCIVTGVLNTVQNHKSVKDTPWEIKATMAELSYTREGLYATGRPGMGL